PLQQPEMLNYLDRMQDRLGKLPFPKEVSQAAARQETPRRRPELLQGENPKAAARRGVLLLGAVVLGKAEAVGEQGGAGGGGGRGGCGAGDPASRLPGQQPGGVHQQRAAHAQSPAPENDPGSAEPETALLELPHRPHRPPPRPPTL